MSESPPELCERLQATVPQIVEQFQRLTNVPPWSNLSQRERVNHLPPLLRAVFESALCVSQSHAARGETVKLSSIHGSTRHAQGFTEVEVLQEYYLLRNATWAFINTDVLHHDAVHSIIRLDVALSLSTVGSLAGFHRLEYERMGKWPAVLEKLVREWEATLLT